MHIIVIGTSTFSQRDEVIDWAATLGPDDTLQLSERHGPERWLLQWAQARNHPHVVVNSNRINLAIATNHPTELRVFDKLADPKMKTLVLEARGKNIPVYTKREGQPWTTHRSNIPAASQEHLFGRFKRQLPDWITGERDAIFDQTA